MSKNKPLNAKQEMTDQDIEYNSTYTRRFMENELEMN